MRKLTVKHASFLLVLCFLLLAVSTVRAGQIEPGLGQRMMAAGPDEYISVLIRAVGTLPGAILKQQLPRQYATRAEQHRAAVNALQATADITQPPILRALASADFAGRVRDVKGFWIDNVISAAMTSSAIAELANRVDVDQIVYLTPVAWIKPVSVPDNIVVPAEATGVAQPGLRAIKADSLWNLGYTGKGRLVASIDTGVDGKHRLLSGNWRGHNGYPVRESWFNPQANDTLPHVFPGDGVDHGTQVMGIMIAIDSLAGHSDTLGVCFDAQWISSAAIDVAGGNIIEAMQWIADPDGDPNTEEDVPDAVANPWGSIDTAGACPDIFWNAIDNIEAAGAAMLFAAGNEGPAPSSLRSPADRASSETNAFAVGMVNAYVTPPTIYPLSSRGPSPCNPKEIKPEVVAPGYFIKTTFPNDQTSFQTTGTSFSAPHVAGAVALLREYNPNATVDTIKWALLHGAHDLGTPGPDNDYGNGMLDLMGAYRLMPPNDKPALYIKRDSYTRPAPGTLAPVVIVLRSQGTAVSNVTVHLVSDDPRLTIGNATVSFGDFVSMGDTASNSGSPFSITVDSVALPGERLPVRFEIAGSGAYSKTVHGAIEVGPSQTDQVYTHDAGNFKMSVSALGMFGLQADGLAPRFGGQGYLFGADPTQSLFEGAFLVGTDAVHVSDNARNVFGSPDANFQLDPGGFLTVSKPGAKYHEETRAGFSDALAPNPIGVFIEQRTLADTAADAVNYLIVEYTIHNRSGRIITGLRAGLYFDWDFPWGGNQAVSDSGGYDASVGVGWMKERGQDRYRGLAVMTPPGTTSYRYFDNNPEIYDGFTDDKKWQAMSEGPAIVGPEANGDGSHLIASGPFTIEPDGKATAAFAIIGATSKESMLASANRARREYATGIVTAPMSLSFTGVEGGTAPPRDLVITNGTVSSVTYDVRKTPLWATVLPMSGPIVTLGTATLSVTPAFVGQQVGTYRDTVLITTSDSVSDTIIVPATLIVTPKVTAAVDPNPFDPSKESVTIHLNLPSAMRVHAKVYDVTGEPVRTIFDDQLGAGEQTIPWDGKNDKRVVAAGVYFCRVEGSGYSKTFKIVLRKK